MIKIKWVLNVVRIHTSTGQIFRHFLTCTLKIKHRNLLDGQPETSRLRWIDCLHPGHDPPMRVHDLHKLLIFGFLTLMNVADLFFHCWNPGRLILCWHVCNAEYFVIFKKYRFEMNEPPPKHKMWLTNWLCPWCTQIHEKDAHDDAIKWKHFPRYWPFVRDDSPHKGQWRGALIFSLICAWINGWVNNGEAGDLRRHSTHCDVTLWMCSFERQLSHLPKDGQIHIQLIVPIQAWFGISENATLKPIEAAWNRYVSIHYAFVTGLDNDLGALPLSEPVPHITYCWLDHALEDNFSEFRKKIQQFP